MVNACKPFYFGVHIKHTMRVTMLPFMLLALAGCASGWVNHVPGLERTIKTCRRERSASIALKDPSLVSSTLQSIDNIATKPAIRLANHAPALGSLSWFGLVSTAMTMGMLTPAATLQYVLTKGVGPTSNAAFANAFPTFVTPANFVFLIWPCIAVLQLVTVGISAFKLGGTRLTQQDLSALTLANIAGTTWLIVTSNSAPGALPALSLGVLPLVPLLSGYPLRCAHPPFGARMPPPEHWGVSAHRGALSAIVVAGWSSIAFQVFSSFTTIASFLALAVELQHGGRVGFMLGRAELAAGIFLALIAGDERRAQPPASRLRRGECPSEHPSERLSERPSSEFPSEHLHERIGGRIDERIGERIGERRSSLAVGRGRAGVVSLPQRSLVKKLVNLLALSGILVKRVQSSALGALVGSPSFIITLVIWAWACKKAVTSE